MPKTITTQVILNIGNKTWKIIQEDKKDIRDIYLNDRTYPTVIHGLQASLLLAFFSWIFIRNRARIVKTLREVYSTSVELEIAKTQYMTLFRES